MPQYCANNNIEHSQSDKVGKSIDRLLQIKNSRLGIIDLSHNLDIEVVTEIFIRINSKGVVLSQADFAMSKISSNEAYGGDIIRKTIDYFCHLIQNPSDFGVIKETREYKDEIAKESFERLHKGVLNFVNETNFKRYIMIVKSAGIVDSSLIRSQNVLNFGYILYLTLKDKGMEANKIENLVRRWIILSILTGRYSSSPESAFDYDIKRFNESDDVDALVRNIEEGELSDAFWSNILVTKLNTSVTSSPYFNMFLIAQISSGDKGFLSKNIDVRSLIEQRGDVHDIDIDNYQEFENKRRILRANKIKEYYMNLL